MSDNDKKDGNGNDIEINNGDIVGLPVKKSPLVIPESFPITTDPDDQPTQFTIPQCDECEDSPLRVTATPLEEPPHTFTLGYECPQCFKKIQLTNGMSLPQWLVCSVLEGIFNLRNHLAEHAEKELSDD